MCFEFFKKKHVFVFLIILYLYIYTEYDLSKSKKGDGGIKPWVVVRTEHALLPNRRNQQTLSSTRPPRQSSDWHGVDDGVAVSSWQLGPGPRGPLVNQFWIVATSRPTPERDRQEAHPTVTDMRAIPPLGPVCQLLQSVPGAGRPIEARAGAQN